MRQRVGVHAQRARGGDGRQGGGGPLAAEGVGDAAHAGGELVGHQLRGAALAARAEGRVVLQLLALSLGVEEGW